MQTDIHRFINMNAMQKDIIELCDGTKPMREIAEHVSPKRGENPEKTLPDIAGFFDYLEERECAFTGKINKEVPHVPERLTFLWVHVTYACNLQCRHCYSLGSLKDELTGKEVSTILDESSSCTDSLVILGGEPFCRDDITEIVEVASAHVGRVDLLTNGTLIDDEKAKILADLNINVQISLEGPDEESNDIIRGKNTFKRALKGIKRLKKQGVTPAVRMTLLKTNMNKIKKIVEFVNKEGLGPVTLGTLQKSQRAYNLVKDLDVTAEELMRAYRRMRELDPAGKYVRFEQVPGIQMRRELCSAGTGMLSVGADGSVYPCPGLMYPEFLAGNVKENPLEEIWKESPVLQKMRLYTTLPGCEECAVRYTCRGRHSEK